MALSESTQRMLELERIALDQVISTHPKAYALVTEAHDLFVEATTRVRKDRMMVFAIAGSIGRFIGLAFLSSLRRHAVQASADIRQALEYLPLLLYYMVEHDNAQAKLKAVTDDDSFDRAEEKLRKDARNWLAREHPEASAAILDLKNRINENTAHARLPSTAMAFDYELAKAGRFVQSFTDLPERERDLVGLLHVALIAGTAVGLISVINAQFPNFDLPPDLETRGAALGEALNAMLEAELTPDELEEALGSG